MEIKMNLDKWPSLTNTLPLVSLQVTQLAVESGGTPLTGMAPALTHGSAAQLSRANDTLKICQTLSIFHFRVTRSSSETEEKEKKGTLTKLLASNLLTY